MDALLINLLCSNYIEHLVISPHFQILEVSPGVNNFADVPKEVKPGKDIRISFPELVGMEGAFESILNHKQKYFELKGIQRVNNFSPLCIDIYITNNIKSDYINNSLLINIIDATEKMMTEQSLIQKANEANFLLRNLTASKQYIDTIIKSMPDALFITTPSGKIKAINPAAQNLLGYEQTEVIGQSIFALIKPVKNILSSHNSSSYQNTTDSNHSLIKEIETTCTTKDGKIIPIAFSCSIVQTEIDNFQGYIYILRDITERKQAELAKQEFLAMITHEIRTPIASVIGLSNLLLNTDLNFEQKQFTETIHQSSNFLLEIVNDILDFSKIESGKLELENQPFDLQTCLNEALYMIAPNAVAKGLEVVHKTPEICPVIVGDITRLRQIIVNLLSNAVKFTEKGSIEISLSIKPVETELNENNLYELQFAIKDTGIGIPDVSLDRLFKAFSQVNSSTNRQYGGTGLGLAICKQLSELMGGRIWVESEVGVGSTFYFTITAPLLSQTLGITASQKWETEIDSHMADLYPLKILLVEDHIINQNVIKLMLQLMGYQPDVANNGLEALSALHYQYYDLVFMDVQMPKMDGVTTAQHICREWPENLRPRIIALTANSTLGERERCLGSGMDDYLTKPINIQQLTQVLKKSQPLKIENEVRETIYSINHSALQEIQQIASLNSGVETEEFLVETIDCYLEEASKFIQDMQIAHNQGNIKVLQRLAHTFCSTSATLGATNLAGLCAELEQMAATVILTGTTEQILKIEAEYKQVQILLQQERNRYKLN